MSSFKIKAITINQQSNVIRITRSLFFNNSDISECTTPKSDNSGCNTNNNTNNNNNNEFYIPEEILNKESIEIIDSIENGSTLLYPYKFKFPNDLIRLKNHKFKIQMVEGSHVIGKFIDMDGGDKVIVDVEEFHSYKQAIQIPKGRISLRKDHIQSYFALNDTTKDNKEKLAKIIITNTSQSREILVCYEISSPVFQTTDWSINMGSFTHYIKGIQSNQIYTNPNLASNIPITITTEFKWTPLWDIPSGSNSTTTNVANDYSYGGNGIIGENEFHSINSSSNNNNNNSSGVTLTIISKEKYTYTIENLVCFKNYENKIRINQIHTTCTRAAMLYPSGPIEIALYFENNTNLSLTKSPIYLVGDEIPATIESESTTTTTTGNNQNNNNFKGFGVPQQKVAEKPTTRFMISSTTNKDSKGMELLKSVSPNSIGIITCKLQNSDKVLIYKDIAHQPLWETKSKEFSITEIKLSNIFTLMDAKTSSKIKYQFVNATPYKTKYIVNTGISSTFKQQPAAAAPATTTTNTPGNDEETNKDIHGSSIEIDYQGWGEKIGESLYLFDSSSLSINNFEMKYSSMKQLMTHQRLPQVVINYLQEKGISIRYNPNKFEIYDLSNLDRNTQDTLLKLMNTLSLEEKTSNYFNKQHSNYISILFDNNPFTSSGFGSTNVNYNNNNNRGAFSFGTTQQQPPPSFGSTSAGLFGGTTQTTSSGFGTTNTIQPPQQTTSGGLFGSTQPQQQTTGGGLFGSAQPQQQQQQQQQQSSFSFGGSPQPQQQPTGAGLFGSTQPPTQQTTGFGGFGSTQPQQTTGFGGFGSAQPQQTTGFGGFGSTQPPSSPPQTPTTQPANSSSLFGVAPTATITTAPKPFSFGVSNNNNNNLFSAQPTTTTTTPTATQVDGVTLASISALPQFSNKSVEEIRNEDNKNQENDESDL